MTKLATEFEDFRELTNKVNEMQRLKHMRRNKYFYWPGVNASRVKVQFDVCYNCLEICPNHCTADCSLSKRHPAAYLSKSEQLPGLDFQLFAQAAFTVQQASLDQMETEHDSSTGCRLENE